MISGTPIRRARRSAAFRMPSRTNSGAVWSRAQASGSHRTGVSGAACQSRSTTSTVTRSSPARRASTSTSRWNSRRTKSAIMAGAFPRRATSRASASGGPGQRRRRRLGLGLRLRLPDQRRRHRDRAVLRRQLLADPARHRPHERRDGVEQARAASAVHGRRRRRPGRRRSRRGPSSRSCSASCSSGVITRTPSARARFSARRRTMPRRNIGARATRASASGVQRTSPGAGSGALRPRRRDSARPAGRGRAARARSRLPAPGRACQHGGRADREQAEGPRAHLRGHVEPEGGHGLAAATARRSAPLRMRDTRPGASGRPRTPAATATSGPAATERSRRRGRPRRTTPTGHAPCPGVRAPRRPARGRRASTRHRSRRRSRPPGGIGPPGWAPVSPAAGGRAAGRMPA